MALVISILGIIITILFVIGTHEAAHFMMARALSVRVITFSIGFGKTLFSWKDKSGTNYVFALIPLGGYVKMVDENEGPVNDADKPYAYNRQPFYKKFLIVLAGPAMNIFCAFVLYWLIFMIGFTTLKPVTGDIAKNSIAAQAGLKPHQEIVSLDNRDVASWINVIFRLLAHLGDKDQITIESKDMKGDKITSHTLNLKDWVVNDLKPDPLESLGITPFEPTIPLIIGVINPNSPASKAQLEKGDIILAWNGKKVKDWTEIIQTVHDNPDKSATITVKRNNKTLDIPLTIGSKRTFFLEKHGILGIGPKFTYPTELLREIKYPPIEALARSWHEIRDFTYFNILLFGKLFTGKLSVQSLGGPITIFETAGDALNSGLIAFLGFLAFLSISIGIINILPIPGLDGGHLVLQIIELIIGRPIPERTLTLLFRLGFIFILVLMFQSLFNDILRVYK